MPRSEDYPTRAKLYESANSLVFRARERATDRPVILKYLKRDYPSPQELARYRQEFEITRALDLPDVIDVYAQFRDRKSLVMVLEDFGASRCPCYRASDASACSRCSRSARASPRPWPRSTSGA